MSALDRLCRAEWGRLLSALIRAFGDFDVAEEALQEAFAAAAVVAWRDGEPRNPRGWLYGAARHKAIDRLRGRARLVGGEAASAALKGLEAAPDERAGEEVAVPDERLRLIFTCCHPALAPELLHARHPTPVVALNRAVAVAMADGPEAGLPLVDALEAPLAEYHLWHAARADLLRRLDRRDEAAEAYRRAHALARNDAERRFLALRLRELSGR